MIFNEELRTSVCQLYSEIVDSFKEDADDFTSPVFLSSFPYEFIRPEDVSRRSGIISAAFAPTLMSKVERNLAAFYAHSHGLNAEGYLCEAVNNFLNYIIPRAVGLSEGTKIFDERYEWFDNSLYGETCLVTTFSVLGNVSDDSGRMSVPEQFRLRYVIAPSSAIRAGTCFLRERSVCCLEIKKRARPIGRGRDISGNNSFFILEHSELLPVKADVIAAACRLRDETAKKFILAARLLGHSASFSDYRGCRMLGALSGYEMNLMNFPDDFVGPGQLSELSERDSVCIGRLLPRLAAMKFEEIQLLDTKLDDILRRERHTMLGDVMTSLKVAIEQLLDCFQILEAIMGVEGSEYMALYSTVLLRESGYSLLQPGGADHYKTYEFIKRMFRQRNAIMHGRIHEVLDAKKATSFPSDVFLFKRMVCHLAMLFVLNSALRETATRLAVGAPAELDSFRNISPEDFNAMRRPKPPHPSW